MFLVGGMQRATRLLMGLVMPPAESEMRLSDVGPSRLTFQRRIFGLFAGVQWSDAVNQDECSP
jgi:hypothetical protein